MRSVIFSQCKGHSTYTWVRAALLSMTLITMITRMYPRGYARSMNGPFNSVTATSGPS